MGSMLAPCRLKRIVEDALHGLRVVQARAGLGGGEAGVRREARIGVDFQDQGVGPRDRHGNRHDCTRAARTRSTATCQFRQPGQESGIRFGKIKSPGRVPKLEGIGVPFGTVADDPWLAGREGSKVDLGRRQKLGPVGPAKSERVELAAVHELLGKARLAPSRLGRANPLGQLSTVAQVTMAVSSMSTEECS